MHTFTSWTAETVLSDNFWEELNATAPSLFGEVKAAFSGNYFHLLPELAADVMVAYSSPCTIPSASPAPAGTKVPLASTIGRAGGSIVGRVRLAKYQYPPQVIEIILTGGGSLRIQEALKANGDTSLTHIRQVLTGKWSKYPVQYLAKLHVKSKPTVSPEDKRAMLEAMGGDLGTMGALPLREAAEYFAAKTMGPVMAQLMNTMFEGDDFVPSPKLLEKANEFSLAVCVDKLLISEWVSFYEENKTYVEVAGGAAVPLITEVPEENDGGTTVPPAEGTPTEKNAKLDDELIEALRDSMSGRK